MEKSSTQGPTLPPERGNADRRSSAGGGAPPLQPQVQLAPQRNPEDALDEASWPRLLVAEDEPVIRKFLAAKLRVFSYRADFASNGREAVEMWQGGNYDLILMDLQMPVLDGLAATRQIRVRERETGGYVPIVAMTAHVYLEDAESCLRAGMDGYITKPFEVRKAMEVIRELLGRRVPAPPGD